VSASSHRYPKDKQPTNFVYGPLGPMSVMRSALPPYPPYESRFSLGSVMTRLLAERWREGGLIPVRSKRLFIL